VILLWMLFDVGYFVEVCINVFRLFMYFELIGIDNFYIGGEVYYDVEFI